MTIEALDINLLGKHYMQFKMSRVMDLVCTAIEGGYCSFTIVEKVKPPELKNTMDGFSEYMKPAERCVYPHVDYAFNKGGAVKFKDKYGDEPDKVYTLDLESLEKGIGVFAEKVPHQFAEWLKENDDAVTGDCYLQCCLLGDVVYG